MTIKDRRRGMRATRLDLARLGDDLARHLQAHEQLDLGHLDRPRVDLAKAREAAEGAVHDAAERARQAIDRAGEQARTLRTDLAHAAAASAPDAPLDELGQRLIASARTGPLGTVIARIERELPETPGARKARESRARAGARRRLLVVGVVAGITAGIVAFLADPKRGKARREAIGRRLGRLTRGLSRQASSTARSASDRAHQIAVERGLVEAPDAVVATGDSQPVATPAWPAGEGPLEQPLHDPAFGGAHEALPEELVSATASSTDPGEPTFRG